VHVDRGHHAKVEVDETAVGRREQVPAVWVGVEEALLEHLLQ
jgi:hypothetical protein